MRILEEKNNEDKKKNSENFKNFSNEVIFKKALIYHSQGKISKAEEYYKFLIEKGLKDSVVFQTMA